MTIDIKKYFTEFLLLISLVIGIFFACKYWGLPPVRNSVIAIKTSIALDNVPFTTDNFVKTTAYTYGKPIGLPIFFFVINKLVPIPHSYYFASLLVGIAYCLSCWWLCNVYSEHLSKNKSLFLLFLIFNPWTFSHFYSIGPDGLYLVLVNLFLILNKLKKNRHSLWITLSVFAVIYFSTLVRLHGLVLILVWIILNQKEISANLKHYYADYLGLFVFGTLILLSLSGKNPFMNLTDNADGGRDDYFKFIFSLMAFSDYLYNFFQVFIFTFTTFSVIPFGYGFKSSYETNKELLQCIFVITLSLLIYRWTYHNTRYFFILIPFIGLVLFEKKNDYSKSLLTISALVFLIGNYYVNFSPDSNLFFKKPEAYDNSSLDNLRLFRRISDGRNIEIIKSTDCDQRQCYIVNNYYHNAYFYIYEIMNYWGKEKNIRYRENLNFIIDSKVSATIWYKNSDTDNILPFVENRFPLSMYTVTQISNEIFNIEHK